jgi:hypothetical protein
MFYFKPVKAFWELDMQILILFVDSVNYGNRNSEYILSLVTLSSPIQDFSRAIYSDFWSSVLCW